MSLKLLALPWGARIRSAGLNSIKQDEPEIWAYLQAFKGEIKRLNRVLGLETYRKKKLLELSSTSLEQLESERKLEARRESRRQARFKTYSGRKPKK